MTTLDNNKVTIAGKITSEFVFNHELYGEGFYTVQLSVERSSGTQDVIPLMVSDRLIDVNKYYIGKSIMVTGQYRSYNLQRNNTTNLVLSVFVRDLMLLDDDSKYDKNEIIINGIICKKPIYRTSPLGREITDVIIAVDRAYGKSDYIPCVTWGRCAKYVSTLNVGDKVKLSGRIQSRQYKKKISETEYEIRTAYEVSVNKLEVIK